MAASTLRLAPLADAPNATSHGTMAAASLLTVRDPASRVLLLRGPAGGTAKGRGGGRNFFRRLPEPPQGGEPPLGWLPLGGFRTLEWRAPLPKRVEAVCRTPVVRGGLGLSDAQMHIVKTCLRSLATSRE